MAIIYIPIRVGGWAHIFSVADTHLKATNPKTGKPNGSLILEPAGEWAYATLALGSALALFMYPHNITGVFAANRRNVIRRNVAAAIMAIAAANLFARNIYKVPAVAASVDVD